MTKLPSFEDIFKGQARRYNHFQPEKEFYNETQSCRTCRRKHFSFPYTCDDGWNHEKDYGPECINWTDDRNCKVD